jgi:hypothetical protein
MSERENLFRPIHKGIRSMLYDLGSQLQTVNFADVNESNQFATRLKHDLGNSLSNCMLCLLSAHASHEERDIFSQVRPHDPAAVETAMKEHAEVIRRVGGVSKTCDEVMRLTTPASRLEAGNRLNEEVDSLLAFYLSHLNHEEALLVPVLWRWFTDEQIRAMRTVFYASLPSPLFETWMRWTLPSLNQEELVALFSDLKMGPETARFDDWVRMARETLNLPRWVGLRERVGIDTT